MSSPRPHQESWKWLVTLTKAGVQEDFAVQRFWIPAYAGMTIWDLERAIFTAMSSGVPRR